MDIKEVERRAKRDFKITLFLVGILPFLVLSYLMTIERAHVAVFPGEIELSLCLTLGLLVLGVILGSRMLWSVLERLVAFNKELAALQEQLVEKARLASITETAMTLCHEVNNPLALILITLDLMEGECREQGVADKLAQIKGCCQRIKEATDKLAHLSMPATREIFQGVKIIDLPKSK